MRNGDGVYKTELTLHRFLRDGDIKSSKLALEVEDGLEPRINPKNPKRVFMLTKETRTWDSYEGWELLREGEIEDYPRTQENTRFIKEHGPNFCYPNS